MSYPPAIIVHVCERLVELRGAMERFAAGFEAELITTAQAAEVVDQACAVKNMAAAVEALAAARMAESKRTWARRGDASAARALARRTGTSVGQALETLQMAKRLKALPATEAAARSGKLSPAQAAAIADAASADPRAEPKLLETAKGASLGELRQDCAATKAAATDAEARRRAIHARRALRTYSDAEGAWNLHMRDNPEVGARIMAVVGRIRDALAARARAEGRVEPPRGPRRRRHGPHGPDGHGAGGRTR